MRSSLRFMSKAFLIAGLLVLLAGYFNAIREPVWHGFTHVTEHVEDKTAFQIVLLADLHVSSPGGGTDHISDIVDRVNQTKPDVVLLAGDIVSSMKVAWSRPDFHEAVAPLAGLSPRLGTYAVLGNHDHWRNPDEGRRELENIGITVLDNEAIKVGPLSLGGVDDAHTGHADVSAVLKAMDAILGYRILLSHSPDVTPEADGRTDLILAGHTHCGQISVPGLGPLTTMSRYGDRYACGEIRNPGGSVTYVSAGIGTSILPLRYGARSDILSLALRSPDKWFAFGDLCEWHPPRYPVVLDYDFFQILAFISGLLMACSSLPVMRDKLGRTSTRLWCASSIVASALFLIAAYPDRSDCGPLFPLETISDVLIFVAIVIPMGGALNLLARADCKIAMRVRNVFTTISVLALIVLYVLTPAKIDILEHLSNFSDFIFEAILYEIDLWF